MSEGAKFQKKLNRQTNNMVFKIGKPNFNFFLKRKGLKVNLSLYLISYSVKEYFFSLNFLIN